MKYIIPLSLIGTGSVWFCMAVTAQHAGLAICAMAFMAIAGMAMPFWENPFKPQKPKIVNRYAVRCQIFPGTEEQTGVLARWKGQGTIIEIQAQRITHDGLLDFNHVFLDKAEAANLRDMLDGFING